MKTLCLLLLLPLWTLDAQTLTAVRIPAAIADGGGTGATGSPYAVFVRIEGWAGGANGQAYLKIYSGTNNEYMWSSTGVWSNGTTYSPSNQPVVSIDAGGNWSGWIYAKHNNALGVTGSVRAARVGSTTTNLTSVSKTFTLLSMTAGGNGGWLVRTSSPALNEPILAYAGGNVVGSYRTEDNGITEGFGYGAGGCKIAVPAGFVDSLVTFKDDGSRDMVFTGPWAVTPGQETDASVAGGLVGRGTAVVAPQSVAGGMEQRISVGLFGSSPFIIRKARFVVPAGWTWSHAVADITVSGAGVPSAAVSGDTVLVSGMALAGGDSVLVGIAGVTPKDSTAYTVFFTMTGTAPDSVYPIGTQPQVFVHGTPVPVSAVKENDINGVPLRNNTLVTVRGVVTVANEFGGPSYIQDNSGGLAIFGAAFSSAVTIGDEVLVSGLVQPFSGLTEIVNPMLHGVVSKGNPVVPLEVTAAQIARDGTGGVEVYEGRLVRLNGVTVPGAGTWNAGTNYLLIDATDTTQIRIDNNTNLVGTPIPVSVFNVTGVVGQFVGAPPYIGGYQIMPRSSADVLSAGPMIATFPMETEISPTTLTVSWRTTNPGTSRIRYGTTRSLEIGQSGNDSLQTGHGVRLEGLTPATVYYLQAFSVSGTDTSFAPVLVASTASPLQSTGAVNVYFNTSVNQALAWQQPAAGNQDFVPLILRRINNARQSIDAALYSLSGTPGGLIAGALVAARNRGVRVRVICESDNRNSVPFTTLVSNGIPFIADTFDPVNTGAGLMHNKFFVVDGRNGAPESAWVWTGSWNPTDPGTNADQQNVVEIQDAALAGAYTLEFNEMWGSATDVPDAARSRFGARKLDDTPHRFVIAGRNVECYFSPSDRTTSHIVASISGARHSVAFALLTLTRTDIRSALVERKTAALKVRGVMDNGVDQGSQYNALVSGGIDVHLKSGPGSSGYLLHHKYGLIDAEDPAWTPLSITGSHNWTNSAENSNNENLLIIQDGAVANQYLQEFSARYHQYGGTDSIRVGVEESSGPLPSQSSLDQNYPNPFNPSTTIRFQIRNPKSQSGGVSPGYGASNSEYVSLMVYDLLGREIATIVQQRMAPGVYTVQFDAGKLASGVYIVRLRARDVTQQRKMLLLR